MLHHIPVDGFHGYMMQHKYPFAVLQMEMDGNGLDVNVHPSKLEVRFSRGEEVYQAVHDAVRETLGGQELIPEVTLEKKRENKKKTSPPPGKKESVPEPFETKRRIQAGTKEAGPGSRPEGRRPVSYEQIAAPSPQSQTIREESPWPSDPAAAHGSAGSASQGRKIPEPAGPRPLYTGQESQAPVSQGQARQVSAGQDTREPDTACLLYTSDAADDV